MLYDPKFDVWRHEMLFGSAPVLDAKETLGHGFKEMRMSTDGDFEQMSNLVAALNTDVELAIERWCRADFDNDTIDEDIQVILPTAPGVSNEGPRSRVLGLAPPFLGPGFRLGARWNRLVETVKTRKKREKTGKKWARYGLKRVKESGSPGPPPLLPCPPNLPLRSPRQPSTTQPPLPLPSTT